MAYAAIAWSVYFGGSMWAIDLLFSRQTISMISVSGISFQVSLVVNGRV